MPSGTAAILNSTVPLFMALLAGALPWFADERLGPSGIVGILPRAADLLEFIEPGASARGLATVHALQLPE